MSLCHCNYLSKLPNLFIKTYVFTVITLKFRETYDFSRENQRSLLNLLDFLDFWNWLIKRCEHSSVIWLKEVTCASTKKKTDAVSVIIIDKKIKLVYYVLRQLIGIW